MLSFVEMPQASHLAKKRGKKFPRFFVVYIFYFRNLFVTAT